MAKKHENPCGDCGGTGKIGDEECGLCSGQGWY